MSENKTIKVSVEIPFDVWKDIKDKYPLRSDLTFQRLGEILIRKWHGAGMPNPELYDVVAPEPMGDDSAVLEWIKAPPATFDAELAALIIQRARATQKRVK